METDLKYKTNITTDVSVHLNVTLDVATIQKEHSVNT